MSNKRRICLRIFLILGIGIFLFSSLCLAEDDPYERLKERQLRQSLTVSSHLSQNRLNNVLTTMSKFRSPNISNSNFSKEIKFTSFEYQDRALTSKQISNCGYPKIDLNTLTPKHLNTLTKLPDFRTRINTNLTQISTDFSTRMRITHPTYAVEKRLNSSGLVFRQTMNLGESRAFFRNTNSPVQQTTRTDITPFVSGKFVDFKPLFNLAKKNYTPLPEKGPVLPASRQPQPLSLPVVPISANIPTGAAPSPNPQNSGGNNLPNNLGGFGFGFPGILFLSINLSNLRAIGKIISGISRRQKNGIGFMLSPRSPAISKVEECILTFLHQRSREEIPTSSCLPYLKSSLKSFHLTRISTNIDSNFHKFLIRLEAIKFVFVYKPNNGLFYFISPERTADYIDFKGIMRISPLRFNLWNPCFFAEGESAFGGNPCNPW